MIEGDYRLQIKILEANDLRPLDMDLGFLNKKYDNSNTYV